MRRKGFTLVELLVSLGLFSIISVLIISFLVSNFTIYKQANNISELQYQAEYILNFMANKIVNSNSISLIKPNNVSVYSLVTVRSKETDFPLRKISFKYGENENENYIFHIMDNNIRYGNGEKDINPSVELGNYVEEMYISLLRDESFQEARIIVIKILMKKDQQKYEAFQAAYIRNIH